MREEITRNNRGQEVFFVNGRLVKSTELSQTLEESYYTLIAKGRFPVAIVQLTLPGSELDVNVHPAKTEIKINGYEELKPQIVEQLKDALWEANITKNAFLPETMVSAAYQSHAIPISQTEQKQHTQTNYDCQKTNITYDQAQKEKNSRVKKSQEQTVIANHMDSVVAEPEKLLQWNAPEVIEDAAEKQPAVTQDRLFSAQIELDRKMENLEAVKDSSEKEETQKKKSTSAMKQMNDSVQLKGVGDLAVIGQLNQSFILAQNEEGLYIIDQHTCHERILYEKFMKAETQKEMISQPLLIPVTVTLSAQQDSILMQHIFVLRDLGFVLENFGDRCYLLRSLPLGLGDLSNIEEFFLDLLHDLSQQKEVTAAVIKEKLLITASCKGAVKAHWSLTEIEMRTLLHDLAQVDNAHTCPHGRPIIYKITMAELYKIFKRGSYHD